MRLNGDFFRIESRMEGLPQGQSGFNIILNPDHLIYKAHFPGQPVTPGVCILQMIQEILSEQEGMPLFIRKIKNVKFTNMNTRRKGERHPFDAGPRQYHPLADNRPRSRRSD